MGRKRNQADHKADTRGGSWTGIPHAVMDSDAYLDLSLWARAILVEIVRKMNGYNNGKIAVSYAYLTARLNNSNKRKIGAAIAELMSHGFLDTEAAADWKGRRSREYRLTFVNTTPGDKHKAATNDYRDWVKPKQKVGNDVSPLKASNGDTPSPLAKKNGNTPSPLKFPNLRKTAPNDEIDASKNGDTSLPLICKPYPPAQNPEPQPDKSLPETPTTATTTLEKKSGPKSELSFEDAVRDQIASIWKSLTPDKQRRLANNNNVTVQEIASFVGGADNLSTPKLAALRSDIVPR